MDNFQSDALKFSDYQAMTHKLTRKLCGWGRAIGGTLSYEDVYQDLALVWVKCRDQFDPSRGVKFATYYHNAALHEWGRLKRDILTQRQSASPSSRDDDGEDYGGIEAVEDDSTLSPEDQMIQQQRIGVALRRNPLMHRLLELSVESPVELQDQLKALQAQHEWAKLQGTPMMETPPVALTPMILSRIFGFNWRHRNMMHLSVPKGY